jgi:hypothetical protein
MLAIVAAIRLANRHRGDGWIWMEIGGGRPGCQFPVTPPDRVICDVPHFQQSLTCHFQLHIFKILTLCFVWLLLLSNLAKSPSSKPDSNNRRSFGLGCCLVAKSSGFSGEVLLTVVPIIGT